MPYRKDEMSDMHIIRATYRETPGTVGQMLPIPRGIWIAMQTRSGKLRWALLNPHEARLLAHQLTEAIVASNKEQKP